jgi:hypothetical protein
VTSMMGHNRPPPDRNFKKRWVSALFAVQRKPYGSIAMAFKIYMEMDSHGRGATISDDEFRDCCGVSDGSCRVFKKWLVDNEFIRIEVRGQRGRKSTFQAVIPGEIPATYAGIDHEIPAPNTGRSEEYRRPLPADENEIPATAAAINEPAAECAAIPASRAPACLESSLREDSYTLEEVSNTPLPPKGPTPKDALEAFHAYNDTALRCGLPQAAKLTKDRERRIIARLRDYGLDGWKQALGNIEKSAFLRGMTETNFRADLDFVCQAKSFGRLHDGGYGNGAHAKPKETELERMQRLMTGAAPSQQGRLIT